MSFLAHTITAVVIGAATLLIAATAAFFVLRAVGRRHWRRMREHMVGRGLAAGTTAVSAWRGHRGGQARHHMWGAIADAEGAVRHAGSLDAAVAEFPALCHTLRRTGDELDQLLRLEEGLPVATPRQVGLRRHVNDVIHAARDIQLAALRACSDATEAQVDALRRQARDEVEIVDAALARVRSALRS